MPHGKICYLEIPANRAEDSARFYSAAFGWRVWERGDGNLAFEDSGGVGGTWVEESDRIPDERTRTNSWSTASPKPSCTSRRPAARF